MELERKRARRIIKLAQQAALDPIDPEHRHGGTGRGVKLKQTRNSNGNAALYLLRKIAGTRPDILQACLDGDYTSANQAARDAGIIHVPTPLEDVQKIWAKATAAERAEIQEWVVGQTIASQNGVEVKGVNHGRKGS